MTYMLRERPDGQFEIIVSKPQLVGIFPERDTADRVCALLADADIDWPEEQPANFAAAAADVAEAEAEVIAEMDMDEARVEGTREAPAPAPRRSRIANLPAVAEKPMPPAMIRPVEDALTEAQLEAAITRISGGEKLKSVAIDLGVNMMQLRGHWARHCRTMQKHLAEGGQQPCSICERPFTPSISSPDKCARCSHE